MKFTKISLATGQNPEESPTLSFLIWNCPTLPKISTVLCLNTVAGPGFLVGEWLVQQGGRDSKSKVGGLEHLALG